MAEFYSFEDVLKELNLDEEELKRMVSEGQLQAFKSEDKMKFKKEDIERLKKEKGVKETPEEEIVLELEEEEKKEVEEPIILDESDLSLEERGAEEVITAEPAEVHEEPKEEAAPVMEEDTGEITEELIMPDAEVVEEPAVITEPALEKPKIPERPSRISTRLRGVRRPVQLPRVVEEEIERKRPTSIWSLLIIMAFLLALYTWVVIYDVLRMQTGKIDQPSGLTAPVVELILKQFWNNPDWRRFHEDKIKDTLENKHFRRYSGPTFEEPDLPKKPVEEEIP
jgi:hypothetical protein